MVLLLASFLLMPEHNRLGAASHNTAFAGLTECKTEFGEHLVRRLERPKVSVISDRWVGGLVHKRWRNTLSLSMHPCLSANRAHMLTCMAPWLHQPLEAPKLWFVQYVRAHQITPAYCSQPRTYRAPRNG